MRFPLAETDGGLVPSTAGDRVADFRVERIDPIADARWSRLIDETPSASVFAHPAWLQLLARCYRYEIFALCVFDGAGAPVLGLPLVRVESRLTGRRIVAVSFSDTCPPVRAAAAGPEADAALAAALVDLHRTAGLDIEIRDAVPGLPGAHVVPRFLVHHLALEPDADAVLKRTSKSQTAGRKKAAREGVTTRVGMDRAALDTFYGLHLATRRHQGVPIQPKRFIRGFEPLFERGLGYVMTAEYQGEAIAAAVFLTCGETTVYKYGASNREHLRLRPNNLLFADAIRRACEAGHKIFDFGRTDTDNEGLATFKRGLGGAEQELSYTYLADKAPEADGHSRAHELVGHLIRRSPAWTGQAIGAALYRHVG